jgi:FAD:protein FMN transferase
MGTYVSVGIWHTSRERADEIGRSCVSVMARVAGDISGWDERSWISRLNQTRSLTLGETPKEVLDLLTIAVSLTTLTEGRYHLFLGNITALWRSARSERKLPEPRRIEHAVTEANETRLIHVGGTVRIVGNGVLDLDGVGKAFVADRGIAYLRAHGVQYARINAGGDLAFLGNTEWEVEIRGERDPLLIDGSCGVATSGVHETLDVVEGMRIHHLIDPRTGYPAYGASSVTAVGESCAYANGLTCAGTVLPPHEVSAQLSAWGARAVRCGGELDIR